MQCGETSLIFQNECNKIVKNLGNDDCEKFKTLETDEERVRFLYSFAKTVPIVLKDDGKSLEEAQQQKVEGNALFAKKDYEAALVAYNEGIVKCPQNDAAGKELLSILVSNRSATFFETERYKETLADIEYMTALAGYPKQLLYKVLLRKARCYDVLGENERAKAAYKKSLDHLLKHANLDENSTKKKAEEIEKYAKAHIQKEKQQSCREMQLKQYEFKKNKVYLSAFKAVTFNEDVTQGRFACAVENIQTGTTLVEEYAHCAVLVNSKSLSNCQCCMVSTVQPFACPTCAYAVFCSWSCLQNGCKSFHKVECKIQPSVFETGCSINCAMALRIITQRPLKTFLGFRGLLKEDDNCLKKKRYTYDDYLNIYYLCRNVNQWKKEQLIYYTCMAIYLLRMLKKSTYFERTTEDADLHNDEAYIGGLLLRHLQSLQFNAHEISELTNTTSVVSQETTYKSEHIGGGVYPTVALFNHSCDPSIIRYNVGSKMIVRAIKPIKAGDIIYENYGPLYTNCGKDERQSYLKDNYWFECLCQACVEMWPQLCEMDENVLRIPCKKPKCPQVFTVGRDVDCPFLTCKICREVTSVFPYLKGLMELEKILPEAEGCYKRGCYQTAADMYVKAIEIYYKYSVSPFPELVKVQQRLRSCMVHAGNKRYGYTYPHELMM